MANEPAFQDGNGIDTLLVENSAAEETMRVLGTSGAIHVLEQGGGSSAPSVADDAAFTVGTTTVSPAGAMFDDTAPDSVDEGDAGVLRMSANRNLYSTIRDAAGNERGVNVNASNQLETAAAATGNVAHDAADSGNPVKIGGIAKETDGTDPGSVAEDDRTDARFDLNGRLLVNQAHPNLFSASENHTTAQTNNALVSAPGAGLHLYLTDVVISNGATAGNVKIVEDTGGTPVDIVEVMYFAANGGAALHFQTPIRLSENVDLGFTSVTSTTHSVTVNGYIAP